METRIGTGRNRQQTGDLYGPFRRIYVGSSSSTDLGGQSVTLKLSQNVATRIVARFQGLHCHLRSLLRLATSAAHSTGQYFTSRMPGLYAEGQHCSAGERADNPLVRRVITQLAPRRCRAGVCSWFFLFVLRVRRKR